MEGTLFLILIVSLWTIGIYKATEEGEVLHKVKLSFEHTLGQYWAKPFFGCPYCMPSIHGFLICGFFNCYHNWPEPWYWAIAQWTIVVACASALNYILFNLIRILLGYAELFEQQDKQEEPVDPKQEERPKIDLTDPNYQNLLP